MGKPDLLLELENVHTYYGDSHILQGMSLGIQQGSVVGVLGRNGAGKTTLMRSIIGFTPPRRGKVVFKGTDISRATPDSRAQMGMGLVPQGRRIFGSLSVQENLTIGARERGQNWNLGSVCSFFPRLKERLNHKGTELSGGEQQMLAVSRALMTQPDLLLMDEPTEGLAPMIVSELAGLVKLLKEQGMTVLVSEQNLIFTLSVADRIYVMGPGRIVYEGYPAELEQNEDVKSRYLGV